MTRIAYPIPPLQLPQCSPRLRARRAGAGQPAGGIRPDAHPRLAGARAAGIAPILTRRDSVPCNAGRTFWRSRASVRLSSAAAWASRRPGFLGGYGRAVDGDRTQVLLVDLGGVLFGFDHQHRVNVLAQAAGIPGSDSSVPMPETAGIIAGSDGP
jgi:hypothetical protein